ncbi:MAG: hypothetical protein APR56_01720 [Methanosaeta sp. SDB]|nr:MAG: hypothetical protein APR56_01720 [Methanosaeta sp. SDB]
MPRTILLSDSFFHLISDPIEHLNCVLNARFGAFDEIEFQDRYRYRRGLFRWDLAAVLENRLLSAEAEKVVMGPDQKGL